MKAGNRTKLLILALDGMDPKLFLRWKAQLPNLAALAEDGSWGPTASTTPAMTFPAWSTFLTGVNPGRHGIFDFTERSPGQLKVRFINSTRRRLPSFLYLASQSGLKVGSVALPTTYPPEALSGFQISGFDTPLPSKADLSHVYPRSLGKKINRELGGIYFGDFNESRIGSQWHKKVLARLLAGIHRKLDLVRLLNRECPVELLLLHVGETDTVGHHFWSFFDTNSPRYVKTTQDELAEAIFRVYRATDRLVGEICALTEPEAIMVVSDHGMGGTSNRMLYLNNFLAERGFLQFSSSRWRTSWVNVLKNRGMKWIPYRLQEQVFRFAGGRYAADVESQLRFGALDWSKTLAYSEEVNYFPSIYLNLQGREPFGIVRGAEAGQLLARLKEELLRWKDPLSNTPVVSAVYRREEIYNGGETGGAPDLILELNRPDGYSYALGRSACAVEGRSWRELREDEYLGWKGGSMNGSHRRMGTLIIKSRNGAASPLPECSLMDIAPTALELLNLDVPNWMEGKSLISAGKTISELPPEPAGEMNYTRRQEGILARKLINLGYWG